MSFLNTVTSKYTIQAASGSIETKEPIKIKWKITDYMLIVTVDNIEYAIIDDVHSQDDVDMDNLKNWIEETYYSDDYKSSAYEPCRLHKKDFAKKSVKCRSCGKESKEPDESGLCDDCYNVEASVSAPKITPKQAAEIKKELVQEGHPVRFLYNGQALDIIRGELASKGSNVIYHPVYFNFTKATSKKIATWLGVKPVFDQV